MDDKKKTETKKDEKKTKKPYTKPQVDSEKIYEQDVLACSKLPGGCGPLASSA